MEPGLIFGIVYGVVCIIIAAMIWQFTINKRTKFTAMRRKNTKYAVDEDTTITVNDEDTTIKAMQNT